MVSASMIHELDHSKQIMFATFCIKQVLHLLNNQERKNCLKAIEAAEFFIERGIVDKNTQYEEDGSLPNYLFMAMRSPALANIFVYDLSRDVCKTKNASLKAIELEQTRYYNELLNFDKIIEDLLGL